MEEGRTTGFRWSMLREEAGTVAAGLLLAAPILHGSLGFGARFAVALLFSGFLVFLSAMDVRHGMLYDRALLPMGCMGAALDLAGMGVDAADGILGACLGGGLLLAVRWASRGGMGGGDVKLGFALGLWLGMEGTLLAVFLAFLSGSAAGALRMLLDREWGRRMAFGPFLSLGAWTAFLYGESILQHYGAWAWR